MIKTVFKSVYASYSPGYDDERDRQARKIMRGYLEEGSGYDFISHERDISWRVSEKNVPKVLTALKKAKFKVRVFDREV